MSNIDPKDIDTWSLKSSSITGGGGSGENNGSDPGGTGSGTGSGSGEGNNSGNEGDDGGIDLDPIIGLGPFATNQENKNE